MKKAYKVVLKEFGEKLVEHREMIGLTQLDAALLVGWTSPQYISAIERGRNFPPRKKLKIFCEIYGIGKDEMFNIMIEPIVARLRRDIFGKDTKELLK